MSTVDRLGKYTMLVAWHKFDRYERYALATILKVSTDKVPFMKVEDVLFALVRQARNNLLGIMPGAAYPAKNYHNRILRAVMKKDRERRQRIRV
jgi:hypothetical protein